MRWKLGTDLTSPISSILVLVSSVNGVEARTQTPPFCSLIAVDLPPTGKTPKRAKGLFSTEVSLESPGNQKCNQL